MRPLFYVCLLAFFLQTACVITQKKLWQPEALAPVESTQARARDMRVACESGEYKGTLFSTLPESASAQCQPQGSFWQECALLLVYPERREFNFIDARSYTATVQAKTWFNVVVNSAGNITQCRTITE